MIPLGQQDGFAQEQGAETPQLIDIPFAYPISKEEQHHEEKGYYRHMPVPGIVVCFDQCCMGSVFPISITFNKLQIAWYYNEAISAINGYGYG